MAMTDFTIIRRSLEARRFSTWTTVLTVAVAVGLMLVLLNMQHAGRRAFERGSGTMHLLVSGDSSPMVAVLNGIFYANAPARPIQWARYEQIAADPRVAFAIPTQQGDSYRGFPVMATTGEFFTAFQPDEADPWAIDSGRFFDKDFEVVLGAAAARDTGLKLGDTIHLTHGMSGVEGAHVHDEFTYTIVGVLRPSGTAHDRALFTTLTSTWLVHAHGDELTEADRLITGVYIRMATRPGATVSAAMPQFAAQLRAQSGFTVASPTDEIRRLFAIVSSIDQIFLAMAAVVMVSSGIAIMLALYNSMETRRRQIAVLRVLGASRARIFGLVVTESVVLGLLGVAAGFVLCLVGGRIVAAVMKERLGLVIEPALVGEWTLFVIVGTIALAGAAGIVPAVAAYRTGVAKNLKPLG